MPNNTKSGTKKVAMTQKDKRQGIDIGPAMGQVSPAAYWYKNRYFQNADEARGAFRLAYQQGLDGMGGTIAEWMGLTSEEYDAWMRTDDLPMGLTNEEYDAWMRTGDLPKL